MDVEIERRRRPIGLHAMDGMHSNHRTRFAHCAYCSAISRYPPQGRRKVLFRQKLDGASRGVPAEGVVANPRKAWG
jgi:hypothetical protein